MFVRDFTYDKIVDIGLVVLKIDTSFVCGVRRLNDLLAGR